jgi:AcrR family transcriptional regulator
MDIREDIIEAALKLLRKHGFGALSQPRIAAEAGVRQGHLTYYFPSRAELLLAVADRSCEVLLAPLHERARRGELTPDEIADRLGTAVTDRGMARIFHTLVSVSEEDESLKPQMRRLQHDSVRDLRELFSGAGLALTADDALMMHALICGASTMVLSVCTPASRSEARGVLRRAIGMLAAARKPARAVRAAKTPSGPRSSRARPAAPPRPSRARKARGK